MTRPSKAGGFSLIELVVVVAIMAVLSSIAMPLAELAQRRTKEEELRRSLREIRTALDAYKQMVDQGRIARAVDASGYPPRLELLADGVEDATSPQRRKHYFLRKLPKDPFAPAGVSPVDSWGLRSYASSAADPQPGKDVYDVHSLSTGVGLNGTPYRDW